MRNDDRVDLRHLALGWDGDRSERLLARVKTGIARRARVRRAVLACALAGASGGALFLFVLRPASTGRVPAEVASVAGPSSSGATRVIRLGEGSTIRLDPSTSEVRVLEEQPSRVRVEAVRGGARYAVAPNAGRAFEVRAGAVTVRVIGTEFDVERREDRAYVAVSRGKVQVSWARGGSGERDGAERAFLVAGESGWFPPSAPAEETTLAAPAASEPRAAAEPSEEARPRPPAGAYRSRVVHRDYHGAYTLLARHPALAGDTVGELLVAADVARLSEHPAEAVPYLQRILREHPRDERAHQAAFTLGRTLARLGDPRAALSMFARVRSEWPGNPLAEDALVREAQAASQLGDAATARRLADEYDRDYPRGRRRAEVRRFGLPESPSSPSGR